MKNDFIELFQTSYEAAWNLYVNNQNSKKVDPEINVDDLQLLYNILVRLPITKEVKLELVHLESKLMQFGFKYGLEVTVDRLWTQSDEIQSYEASL